MSPKRWAFREEGEELGRTQLGRKYGFQSGREIGRDSRRLGTHRQPVCHHSRRNNVSNEEGECHLSGVLGQPPSTENLRGPVSDMYRPGVVCECLPTQWDCGELRPRVLSNFYLDSGTRPLWHYQSPKHSSRVPVVSQWSLVPRL